MGSTIKDVAKLAGVAISTASRVINDSGYVSDETRIKVESAVDQLDYTPNAIARSLKQKSTFSLGLVVADIGNPFFSELAQAVERAAREQGYSVLLVNTDGKMAHEDDGVHLLISKQVDGIIWYSPINTKLAQQVSKRKDGPVIVTISGKPNPVGTHSIYINDEAGAVEAVNHLIRLGHKRIGYIAEPEGEQYSQARLQGYLHSMEKGQVSVVPELIVRGDFQEGSGRRAIKKILAEKQLPTAIFAANDLMAIEAIQYAREIGLDVPGELAIVGFDDIKFAGLRGIDLTTVAQPKYEMGQEATKLLISSLKREQASRQISLLPSLVIRRSCGYHQQKAAINW